MSDSPRSLWKSSARKSVLQVVAAVVFGGTAAAAEITGHARVVDGDTLYLDGAKIRFNGIDAPETDQVCLDDHGKHWACGITARDKLVEHIGASEVTCSTVGTDQYGRFLAQCRVGEDDLQRWLVRQGLALSYRQYSHAYDADEEVAHQHSTGMWSGAFIAPWDWRHRNKQTEIKGAYAVPINAQTELLGSVSADAAPNSQCVIKGNVNRKGERIYHMPGMRDYAHTRMDKGTGERWFCTEDEAAAAGWRKAMR